MPQQGSYLDSWLDAGMPARLNSGWTLIGPYPYRLVTWGPTATV